MDSILSAFAIYVFLLVLFRVTGTRSLAEITTFDIVLILVVAEVVEGAIIHSDESLTNALLVVMTLVGVDVFLSIASMRSRWLDKLINDVPMLLIDRDQIMHDRMRQVRVSEDDILEQARAQHGVERLEQVKYAVLERDGSISIIPGQVGWAAPPPSASDDPRVDHQGSSRTPARGY
jgi:uncharacterized membrane protein YcaP (DUF421 family)